MVVLVINEALASSEYITVAEQWSFPKPFPIEGVKLSLLLTEFVAATLEFCPKSSSNVMAETRLE